MPGENGTGSAQPNTDAGTGTTTHNADGTPLESSGAGGAGEAGGAPNQGGEGGTGNQGDPGSQGAEGGKEGGEGDGGEGAAEYKFALPEGVELDAKLNEDFVQLARELEIAPDKAQRLVDLYLTQQDAAAAAIEAAHTATVQEWVGQVKEDQEIGGAKLDTNLAIAKKALDKFGTPELTKMLVETGIGNHPEMVRLAYRAGRLLLEDPLISGGSGGDGPKDIATLLYGSQGSST